MAPNRLPEHADTARASGTEQQRYNIGEVLDLLRQDFDAITIPKIRFLEDQGLVKPERTPAGYRKFRDADVERLRYILRMQRDHYLPLKVIGEHLDAMDRGLEPPPVEPVVPTVPQVALAADGVPSPESFSRRDNVRLSRKELLKIAAVSEDLLAELEQFGLITAQRTGHYDSDALVIAQTARELADFGLEPRHLRGMKAAVDREVGLVKQIVEPHRRANDAAAQARAEQLASEIAALAVRLHATLVKAGLRRP
ncbi:MAG TPA: MerR family transcriptional regulator [Nocardioides sp.]|uniref:transcriptional regulator FtsR n=1 Tax=Nocardioides sp. TaxID=35761 RepID=UPI002EDAB644